jgi:uncharacterized protein (DUF2235 family)
MTIHTKAAELTPASNTDLPHGSKRIVICADGTGNADVKGRGSNVFKLFEAVDTVSHLQDASKVRQVALYHEGVGTENWWPRRQLGGAFGRGVRKNVCHLYEQLSHLYQPGDKLFLFGFSRGAYTVRKLAALIDCCGILASDEYASSDELKKDVSRCFGHLMNQPCAWRGQRPRGLVGREFDDGDRPIAFLGAWDTVDAVGLPFASLARAVNKHVVKFKSDVSTLPECVECACHALALDDERKTFAPELWRSDPTRIEQVWFAGAHSDVGGGYPRQGLSLIPLHWMMRRAASKGLRFVEADLEWYKEHQQVADRLHDSRQGVAVLYRWRPRDVGALCHERAATPSLHLSVCDRIAQKVDGYSPVNIPAGAKVATTEPTSERLVSVSDIEAALAEVPTAEEDVPRRTQRTVTVGVFSYWLFLAGMWTVGGVVCLVGILAVIAVLDALPNGLASRFNRSDSLPWLLTPRGSSSLALSAAALLALASALVGVAYWLGRATDTAINRMGLRLWHGRRKTMQIALSRRTLVR